MPDLGCDMDKYSLPFPDWDAYTCNLNGYPASISLDMALQPVAPVAAMPHLIQVGIFMKDPDPIGMPGGGELETLALIELAVRNALERSCMARLAGRAAFQGKRYLFFYAAAFARAASLLTGALEPFSGYSADIYTGDGDGWATYSGFLWPSARDLFRIHSRRRLLGLLGDFPEDSTGDLIHQFRFADQGSRVDFSIRALSLGLDFLDEDRAEGENVLARFRSPGLRNGYQGDAWFGLIWDLVHEFGGCCLGWEATGAAGGKQAA